MSWRVHIVAWLATVAIVLLGTQLSLGHEDVRPSSVFSEDHESYTKPLRNLVDVDRRLYFFVGKKLFNTDWRRLSTELPGIEVYPEFNAFSCAACHIRDGRSPSPQASFIPLGTVFAVKRQEHGRSNPRTVLFRHAGLELNPEGRLYSKRATYPDGTQIDMPAYLWTMNNNLRRKSSELSARIAPPVFGLGLLEQVPGSEINRLSRSKRDGISGKVSWVWDFKRSTYRIGRFGWKATEADLCSQVQSASKQELGLAKSDLGDYVLGSKTTFLPTCDDFDIKLLAFYVALLGVPEQRNAGQNGDRGKELFASAGCTACHIPTLHTQIDPTLRELGNQEIHPYTDLLLHDMGTDLSESPNAVSRDREWRTAPLWGVGLTKVVNPTAGYLHDGRARTLEEAILWHGGESKTSRERFMSMSQTERTELIAFLGSL